MGSAKPRAKKTSSASKAKRSSQSPRKGASQQTPTRAKKASPQSKPATTQRRAKAPPKTKAPVSTKAKAPARGQTSRTNAAPRAVAPSPKAAAPKPTPAVVKAPAKASISNKNAVETARRNLKALINIVEQAGDRDAELILGEGRLEALLKAVLPPRRRSEKTTYDYLANQKRRASLMAEVRHSINDAYSFPLGAAEETFLSPTRVQWFYDGLTFIEGSAPFTGVVGLYRDGELRYGLDVKDTPQGGSLGPSESDFVSIQAAKRSFAEGARPPHEARGELQALVAADADSRQRWLGLIERYPWMLGAQHLRLLRLARSDQQIPELFMERAEDGMHDVLLLGEPAASVFGKSGRMQRSFQESLHQAEQTLSFVQRQADYLEREFQLRIRRPRVFVIAGRGLGKSERDTLRHYIDARHAELRVLSFDDLVGLALRTVLFFEDRVQN